MLNDIINLMPLTDIYRNSNTNEDTFLSAVHGIFSKIYHIVGQVNYQQIEENRNIHIFYLTIMEKSYQSTLIETTESI